MSFAKLIENDPIQDDVSIVGVWNRVFWAVVGIQQGSRTLRVPIERAGDAESQSAHRAERALPLLRGAREHAELRCECGGEEEMRGRCWTTRRS